MNEMRKLMQIVENASPDASDKQKLDERILGGIAPIPPCKVAVEEDRSREEYETHITKKSYAPHNPMGDVQMEETECESEEDEHDDELEEGITVVHEEELSDEESCDDKDKSEEEELEEDADTGVDPVVLAGLKKMFGE